MVIVPQIQAANIGMADSLILMVMALVVFGPRRLPEIGRQIGKLMYEFRKASNDFKYQMEEELRNAEEADRRRKEEARLAAMTPVPGAEKEEKQEPDVTPQVLDTGEGAPSYYEAAAKESDPYPYGGDVPPAETETSPATLPEAEPEPETATPASVTAPRIQPPSTGAPVAYQESYRAPAEPSAAEPEAPGAETAAHAADETAATEVSSEGTEQAAHHG